MLDALESYLALWTGRTKWPYVQATLEEDFKLPQEDSVLPLVPNVKTADIFSYEIGGKIYVADISEVLGEKDIMGAVGNKVKIQYNPLRPKQFYYAPARQLANRVEVAAIVLAGAAAIAVTVAIHR